MSEGVSAGSMSGDASGESAGPSVWRFVHARRAHVVIDAAAYFELLGEAMLAARRRIMLVGWDFDTRIRISGGRRWWHLPRGTRYPARFGAFVVWLARRRRSLHVHVLRWNFGALKFLLRGSMILDIVRWTWNRHIHFRLDAAHPLGCSHHQKLVVLDDDLASCGGIDMTGERWDTPEHLDGDRRRRRPDGKLYAPWHDLAMLVEGEAAAALGELARERWHRSGGRALGPCETLGQTLGDAPEENLWPGRLVPEFRDVEVGIARTRAAWRGSPEIREVEALFLEHIARARAFIYAESQYFASRRIAEAMARRLAEPDPPEIVFVTSDHSLSWLQRSAMDTARVRLLHALHEVDRAGRLHVYVPVTAAGTPIYVHAKLMIVDDEVLRIGSANLNNRSMGLDSECDLFLDAARPANAHIAPAIARLRHRLLAEHAGIAESGVREALDRGMAMAEMIAEAPADGKRLVPFALRPLTEAEKALADTALLDPESPEEIFEPIGRRRGLFRPGGLLHRPRAGE